MAAMVTLASLARSELPEALQELNQKHVYINDVIQWCETSYQTGNKKEVQAQTKEYLVDSLESVAKEVENVADKLSDFLTLQGNALDDLARARIGGRRPRTATLAPRGRLEGRLEDR